MNLSRRTALETGLGALTAVAVAGCLDDSSVDEASSPSADDTSPNETPTNRGDSGSVANDSHTGDDRDHTDDYPEGFDEPNGTETGTVDETGYETYAVGGEAVPMAPTADVYDWYASDEELVLVDARSTWAYERRHIEGAVSSPAPDGLETDDPLADVPTDARIVAYCTCPRKASGHRAATLIENGYTDVYLLKDGLYDWVDHGHPVVGTTVE